MRYSEINPKPLLAQYVECFWTLESDQNAELLKLNLPKQCRQNEFFPTAALS